MGWRRELDKAWKRVRGHRSRLTRLANFYGSDKGDRRFDRHDYARIYDALFSERRDEPLRLLEIGLLNSHITSAWRRRSERYAGTAAGSRAPSLEMWAAYFPKAEITGFDINDFTAVRIPRCQIVRGDMGSRTDLARVAALGPFDIVIEDASHASHHQQIALGCLFPHVRAGGLYIIEDLNWWPPIELPGAVKTVDVLRNAAVTGSFETSPYLTSEERRRLETDVASIRLYDSASPLHPLQNDDALAVIRKVAATSAP